MFTCTHRPNSAAPELRACLGRMAFRRRARNEQNHDASCLTISPLTMPTPPTQCRIAPRGRAMGTPAQSRIERRLTAVLAADIAGYSRLMGIDEVGTARALREYRAAVDRSWPAMAGGSSRPRAMASWRNSPPSLPQSSALSRFRSSWQSGTQICWRIGKCGFVSASISGTC